MARGAIAKTTVENKIREAFGSDFVGVSDKKLYVWADDEGERVQIAISLTCPKVPLGGATIKEGINFDDMPAQAASPVEFKPAEMTSEEVDNVRKLLQELGL